VASAEEAIEETLTFHRLSRQHRFTPIYSDGRGAKITLGQSRNGDETFRHSLESWSFNARPGITVDRRADAS
jgi:hypothetical protein